MNSIQSGEINPTQTKPKKTQSLLIDGVDSDLLKQVKAKGRERSPAVERNHLIVYLLERFAADDVVILSEKGATR